MNEWTDAEYEWANDHNGCDMGNDCWADCATYWLEEARHVLAAPPVASSPVGGEQP